MVTQGRPVVGKNDQDRSDGVHSQCEVSSPHSSGSCWRAASAISSIAASSFRSALPGRVQRLVSERTRQEVMLFLPVCSSLAENAKCLLRLYSDPANTDQRKGTNIVKRPPLL